jgi:hypothetical protein
MLRAAVGLLPFWKLQNGDLLCRSAPDLAGCLLPALLLPAL